MSTIDKIIALLDSTERTQKQLTDFLGIEKSVFTTWKSGKSQSYNKYLSKIAEFFNVSTDYLLRDTISLDFEPHEDDAYLIKCPLCKDNYSHFTRIIDVDFYSKKSYGIAIEFTCEPYGHKFYYVFESYKGNSYMIELDEEDIHNSLSNSDKKDVVIPFESKAESINDFEIKKYRTLDEHGKKLVDLILHNEYERCVEESNESKTIKLPMAELKASAGTGQWLGDDEYTTWVDVLDTPEARRANVVIEVSGDSMLPKYHNGDKVLVKLQPTVEQNEIGIFIVDNCGYIKKFGVNELISVNKNYDNIPLNDYNDVTCVGKVVGIAEIV